MDSEAVLNVEERSLYIERGLFGNSSSLIIMQTEGGHASFAMAYKLEGGSSGSSTTIEMLSLNYLSRRASTYLLLAQMAEKRLISSEDLVIIRDCHDIPLTPKSHKTPRDYHLGYIYLNECILRAGVQLPFEFGVAKALMTFHVPPA
ncbi:hypothetical protein ACLOJK_017993 [Asimina triloba]